MISDKRIKKILAEAEKQRAICIKEKISTSWIDPDIEILTELLASRQTIETLQKKLDALEADIPLEQACKRIAELEEAIREFILIEGIKDYTPGYDVMYDMGLSLLKKTIGNIPRRT